ncbi:MAG TPA: L-histidine N(alpha)-methyltransferase [bacterium]|nr:L-histidine N(alpha)-methyltransferase [bacterium]
MHTGEFFKRKKLEPEERGEPNEQTEFLDLLSNKEKEELLRQLQERGLKSILKIKTEDIKIESVNKKSPEKQDVLYNESILEINGTIKLDNFLLTEGAEEFNWQTVVNWANADHTGLNKIAFLNKIHNIDFEGGCHFEINEVGYWGERSGNVDGTKILNKKEADKMQSLGLEKVKTKFVYNRRDESQDGGDTIGVKKVAYSLAIRKEINRRLREILDNCIGENFSLKGFERWETLNLKFNLDLKKKLSEEQVKELCKQGLETGSFDPLLFYLGAGAKDFLEFIARDDYSVNTEFQLIKNNLEVLAREIQGTEIYDLGPGNGTKAREILEFLVKKSATKIVYHPIDVSTPMVMTAAQEMKALKEIEVVGAVTDFRKISEIVGKEKNSFLFLGCTLSNEKKRKSKKTFKRFKKGYESWRKNNNWCADEIGFGKNSQILPRRRGRKF